MGTRWTLGPNHERMMSISAPYFNLYQSFSGSCPTNQLRDPTPKLRQFTQVPRTWLPSSQATTSETACATHAKHLVEKLPLGLTRINKSIRSGAAMVLFLQNVSSDQIMILGQWDSEAFLVYIRPQVLEWTNSMSKSMIAIDSFTDISTALTDNSAITPHTTSMAPHLWSFPVFISGTE
jgi:hypothetical protein